MNVFAPALVRAYRPAQLPLTAAIAAVLGGGIKPKPGDYLLTTRNGDYLTDELGNRLTA